MKLWQKIFLVVFAGLILFPPAVEFAHVFSGHKHDFCNHYAESHFHEKNMECKLFDFQKNPLSYLPLFSWKPLEPEVPLKVAIREYFYLSSYQNLHFSLRAPPVEV